MASLDDPATTKARMAESIGTLKTLHGVVVGLALAKGLDTAFSALTTGGEFVWDGALIGWVLALLATLIPFHHGALRHLDDTYVHEDEKQPKVAIVVDYLLLFLEASLLVFLSVVIGKGQLFFWGFVALLVVDVVWAGLVWWLTTNPVGVQRWAFLNLGFVALLLLGWWLVPDLAYAWVWLAAIARSAVDYGLNLTSMYFPNLK